MDVADPNWQLTYREEGETRKDSKVGAEPRVNWLVYVMGEVEPLGGWCAFTDFTTRRPWDEHWKN